MDGALAAPPSTGVASASVVVAAALVAAACAPLVRPVVPFRSPLPAARLDAVEAGFARLDAITVRAAGRAGLVGGTMSSSSVSRLLRRGSYCRGSDFVISRCA